MSVKEPFVVSSWQFNRDAEDTAEKALRADERCLATQMPRRGDN
jgi:hypothetical protein